MATYDPLTRCRELNHPERRPVILLGWRPAGKIAGLNPLCTGTCGVSRLRSTTKSPLGSGGSHAGADGRRARTAAGLSRDARHFIAIAVKKLPVILLGWRAVQRIAATALGRGVPPGNRLTGPPADWHQSFRLLAGCERTLLASATW